MYSYTTPGVYRQDIFTPPPPPFLTGIPAFLGYATGSGRAAEEYVNEPQLLTLWTHYEQLYGAPSSSSYLAHAVRGFFENGGLMCYVVRLQEAQVPPQQALAAGLDALIGLETIDLVCAPDIMRNILTADAQTLAGVTHMQEMVLTHCRQMGTRFAILDSLNTTELFSVDTDEASEHPASVQEQRARLRSSHGALYFPWLLVVIPDGNPISVPPCGHIAGIYARSDQRNGVHKAPANESLAGVLDLRRHLTEREAGQLNEMGVNSLRAFPGRGMRVWARAPWAMTKIRWPTTSTCAVFLLR